MDARQPADALDGDPAMPMTTKSLLLDLLDAEEFRLRNGQDKVAQALGINQAAYKQIKLTMIDRARQLVEKGPDEP
jgi:hypothetical protein